MGAILALLAFGPVQPVAAAELQRLDQLGPAFSACWHPPHPGDEATVSVSLRRDGSVLGVPRITYVHPATGAADAPAVRRSVEAAVVACTPLHLADRLGGAIAGRVFLIRFVARRPEQRA